MCHVFHKKKGLKNEKVNKIENSGHFEGEMEHTEGRLGTSKVFAMCYF